jgi:hypothetical protein
VIQQNEPIQLRLRFKYVPEYISVGQILVINELKLVGKIKEIFYWYVILLLELIFFFVKDLLIKSLLYGLAFNSYYIICQFRVNTILETISF